MTGTTPRGTANENEASQWIREMFARLAPRYDLANHLLSLNIDRYWRRRTVKSVRDVLCRPGARTLDLCCGTGDLTLALRRACTGNIMGSDFCHPMLLAAAHKAPATSLFEADALCLPLAGESVDLITCAFGFRNLANYDAGLREFRRVLKPDGRLAILEFSQPTNRLFAATYAWYTRVVLPRIGGLVSRMPDAYRYLPESVEKFPGPDELADRMKAAGFPYTQFERLTGGIVALHLAHG